MFLGRILKKRQFPLLIIRLRRCASLLLHLTCSWNSNTFILEKPSTFTCWENLMMYSFTFAKRYFPVNAQVRTDPCQSGVTDPSTVWHTFQPPSQLTQEYILIYLNLIHIWYSKQILAFFLWFRYTLFMHIEGWYNLSYIFCRWNTQIQFLKSWRTNLLKISLSLQ